MTLIVTSIMIATMIMIMTAIMIQVFVFIKISANITKTNIVTAIMIISNRNIKNNSSHQGLHTVQTKSSQSNIKKGEIFIT